MASCPPPTTLGIAKALGSPPTHKRTPLRLPQAQLRTPPAGLDPQSPQLHPGNG